MSPCVNYHRGYKPKSKPRASALVCTFSREYTKFHAIARDAMTWNLYQPCRAKGQGNFPPFFEGKIFQGTTHPAPPLSSAAPPRSVTPASFVPAARGLGDLEIEPKTIYPPTLTDPTVRPWKSINSEPFSMDRHLDNGFHIHLPT